MKAYVLQFNRGCSSLHPVCSNSIFGSQTQKYRHLTLSCFCLTLFRKMDLDDDRELRISSGSIIGVIMLLLAMLPRDVRSDLIVRLTSMNNQETLERAGGDPTTAAGTEKNISDGELSELFEE